MSDQLPVEELLGVSASEIIGAVVGVIAKGPGGVNSFLAGLGTGFGLGLALKPVLDAVVEKSPNLGDVLRKVL